MFFDFHLIFNWALTKKDKVISKLWRQTEAKQSVRLNFQIK